MYSGNRVPASGSQAVVSFPAEAPVPTEADYVTAQQGFQHLVSYEGNGFVPASLSVKKGETVRFTNNVTQSLELTIGSVQSPALSRGRYFEYTFNTAGTITYKDASGHSGTVTVK